MAFPVRPLPIGVTNVAIPGFRDPSDTLRWVPGEGFVQLATDMPGEPLRTYSVYGVRGSSKYPMGKAWTEPWEIEGWDVSNNWIFGIIIITLILLRR